MAGFFCITRISGTSHKIGRNFSQDLPHLVTRYQASRFLASFYVLFCGHIPLPVGNMPLPKNCPQKSFRSFSLSANCLFMGFPAEGLALKILQPGIYSFSRHIRFFSYGCVLSGIFGVFPMYLRAFHLSAIGYAEEFFFQSERFRGINSSAGMPMNKAFAERLKLLKEK